MAWSKDAQDDTDYLDFGVAPVTGTGARTTLFRFKTSDTYAGVVRRMGGWGNASSGQKWGWRLDHAASYHFRMEVDGGYGTSTTAGLNDGVWHYVGFGVPASDNLANLVMFIDGSKETVTTSNQTVNTGSTNDLWLGVDSNSSAIPGAICEYADMAIYDRLLSDNEFAAITGNHLTPLNIPNGLVLYAPLIREYQEIMGLGALSEVGGGTNTSIAAHPPTRGRTAQILQFPPGAAVVGTTGKSNPFNGPLGGPLAGILG